MYLNITDSEKGNNKGSSAELVHYLDKESRLFPEVIQEHWFNGTDLGIPSYEVKNAIDNNIAKLCKTDAKFFLLNINPSEKEIEWLKQNYGDSAKAQLKAYSLKIMDEYAKNFNRPGIRSHKDLLWFAKLENYRYYRHKDKEVKNGEKKVGELKPGEHMHIQIVVSRKDISNKVKLSPMNRSKGRNKAHSQLMGEFNRSAFKQSGEWAFDKLFGFQRPINQTYQYVNMQKNGTLEQRIELQKELQRPAVPQETKLGDLKVDAGFLDILLMKAEYDPQTNFKRKRKKRRRGQHNNQDLTL